MTSGLLAAIGAATCFETGYALQAIEARGAPGAEALRASLMRRLLTRRRWLAGLLLTIGGAALQVLALSHAPVVVVQAVLAFGLVGLLVLARVVLHERIGVRALLAVVAVAGGVAIVAISAPANTSTISSKTALAVSLGVLGAITLAPFALRSRRPRPLLSVAAAAAGDGLGAVALKLVADALAQDRWWAVAGSLVLACAGGIMGLTAEMSALQRVAASRVGPLVVAAQVVVPAVVAAAALGEQLAAGTIVGLALTITGAGALASVPGVVALQHPEVAEHDAGRAGELAEGRVR